MFPSLAHRMLVLALALGCLGPELYTDGDQTIIPERDFEFKQSRSNKAVWDLWHPSSGTIGASFALFEKQSPPDGTLVQMVRFEPYTPPAAATPTEYVGLTLTSFDSSGMTLRLTREDTHRNGSALAAYRGHIGNNTAVSTDATFLRLSAAYTIRNAEGNSKSENTFRVPPPPTVLALKTGAQLPALMVRLTAEGAMVTAAWTH